MSARCSEFAEVQDVAKTPFSSQNRVGNTSGITPGNTSENTPGSTSGSTLGNTPRNTPKHTRNAFKDCAAEVEVRL